MKQTFHLISLIATAVTLANAASWTADDLSWSDSGGASSSVNNGTLVITASKNSQVEAGVPLTPLSETGRFVRVSCDIAVSDGPFADDGSSLRIGFKDSTSGYAYYAALEPVGGGSQAIFGETDDTNLGRFDVQPLGAASQTVTFELMKTGTGNGMDLTASGSLVTEPGGTITVEPDILPLGSTSFDTVYFYCSGALWLGGQTITLSNLLIECVETNAPDPEPEPTNALHRLSAHFENATNLLVSYSRAAPGIETCTLETATSLVSNDWKTAAAEMVGSPVAGSNGTEQVTYRVAATNSIGFVRLIISTGGDTNIVVSSVELLNNGTFEEGDIGWSSDGSHTIVSDVVHSGSCALRYEAPDSYAGVQVFYIVGGRQYKVSGWVKTAADFTDYAGISVNFRDMDAANLGGGIVQEHLGPGIDWTYVEQIFTAPATAVKMKVLLGTGGTGYVWYDDISCIPWEHPADPAIAAPALPPIAGTWTATFTDEFSGTGLDGSKWQVSGLNGDAVSSPDRIAVSNGVLNIRAEKIPAMLKGVSSDWSSAQISGFSKFKQLYGYWEARIRYEAKVGLWPAFWTMPDHGNYGDTNKIQKAWLKFDLSAVSGPVTNAQLQLTVAAASDSSESLVGVFPAPDTWTENNITWNNMPQEDPLWLAHDFFIATPGDVRVYDVSDYVAEQMDDEVSFCLADTFRQIMQLDFHSREAAAPADRPQLIVNGTALEPAADATVRSGTYADTNYGTSNVVSVYDIWARDTRTTYDGGMEIDVFEWLGVWEPYRLHWALHWDGYFADHTKTNQNFYVPGNTVEEYHTYGFYWEPGLIEFYFDGESVGLFESNRVCSVPSYPILSLQMGGWSGNDNPDNIDETEYPGLMEVDYVKIWSGTRD